MVPFAWVCRFDISFRGCRCFFSVALEELTDCGPWHVCALASPWRFLRPSPLVQDYLRHFSYSRSIPSGAISVSRIPARNQRLDEISRLDSKVRDGMRIVSAPVACLHNAHALLRRLEEEHIADGMIL